MTFSPHFPADPLAEGFGALESLDEDRLSPGFSVRIQPRHDVEIVTYVLEGKVAYGDSTGGSGLIQAGEFRRMSAARGRRHSETNASRTEWAHLFRFGLAASDAALGESHEQRRFSAAERRGVLCVVASQDGRRGSLRVRQDARLHSALLDPGQHLVHELAPGRSAWLHVVRGELRVGDLVLSRGDGAGFQADRAVSLTARTESEVLLLDLVEERPRSREERAGHEQGGRA